MPFERQIPLPELNAPSRAPSLNVGDAYGSRAGAQPTSAAKPQLARSSLHPVAIRRMRSPTSVAEAGSLALMAVSSFRFCDNHCRGDEVTS